jgi:hypothetical protein
MNAFSKTVCSTRRPHSALKRLATGALTLAAAGIIAGCAVATPTAVHRKLTSQKGVNRVAGVTATLRTKAFATRKMGASELWPRTSLLSFALAVLEVKMKRGEPPPRLSPLHPTSTQLSSRSPHPSREEIRSLQLPQVSTTTLRVLTPTQKKL